MAKTKGKRGRPKGSMNKAKAAVERVIKPAAKGKTYQDEVRAIELKYQQQAEAEKRSIAQRHLATAEREFLRLIRATADKAVLNDS